MSASRAYWKGYLKLSFVSCPVALYPATSAAERLSFRQVNRRTGHRLKHKLVDAVTGEAVNSSNKARGYEVGENEFLLVEDQEIERARNARPPPGAVELAEPPSRESPSTAPGYDEGEEEHAAADGVADNYEEEEIAPIPPPRNTRTIEIERFLPAGQVDARYFDKPYYIAPREEVGQETFAVIRDAMTRERVSGLARVVLSSREHPFLIEPMGNGLCGVKLRFVQEVRGADDYFRDIPEMKLPPEMLKLAQHIIRSKSEKFDPSMLKDHYRTALVSILEKKQAKRPKQYATSIKPSRENIVSLMDALRRSIAAERPAKLVPRRRAGKAVTARRPVRTRRAG